MTAISMKEKFSKKIKNNYKWIESFQEELRDDVGRSICTCLDVSDDAHDQILDDLKPEEEVKFELKENYFPQIVD